MRGIHDLETVYVHLGVGRGAPDFRFVSDKNGDDEVRASRRNRAFQSGPVAWMHDRRDQRRQIFARIDQPLETAVREGLHSAS